MELTQYSDYRTYLRAELEVRIQKNSAYSLRAFAQQLGMTPQMLSFVLNRKKNISLNMAERLLNASILGPRRAPIFLI